MASTDLNNQDDEGFLALLKPIQDLTRNWDVDLSLHLEEYLSYIKEICGEKLPDMNFAQAAVLVQNSANIYSKKVDYLFMTVMDLLDNITKKRNNAKGKDGDLDRVEEGEEGGQNAGPRRRRAATLFDADEFNLMDDAYTDRNILLDIEKEFRKVMGRKKQSIILNPPSKSTVTSNNKLSCTVYDHADKPLGKKEEFRLNWRISSEGILHEEFVLNKTVIAAMEPVEITVIENGMISDNEAEHDYDDAAFGIGEQEQDEDNACPLGSSLLSIAPNDPDRESDVGKCGNVRKCNGKVGENNLNIKERDKNSKMKEWEPNNFNNALEDKPIRRRNTIKIPTELNTNENKRKHSKERDYQFFTITDILINPGKDSSETFGKDADFSFQAKMIMKEKKRKLQQHRMKYKDLLQNDDAMDQIAGFPELEDDDDNSDGDNDFLGFGAADQDDLDDPVNDVDIISSQGNQNWNGDNPESYEATAKLCMQAYNKKKQEEFGKLTPEMAQRVAEWHHKVIPLLEAAEERSSFDIHGYGTKILNYFESRIGSTKTFAEIVAGEPQQEISRYFLSTLLLTNQYNLEISKTSSEVLETDCVSLKLLSTVRHHEELDDNMQLTTDR